MAERKQRPRLDCPRCGYDLSGIAASWVDACPLEGVCSECGLGFEFRHLLNPRLVAEEVFFEVSERRKFLALRTTLRRGLLPWEFWRWVRMEMPLRPARLVTRALGALLSLYGIGFVAAVAALWVVRMLAVVALTGRVRFAGGVQRHFMHDALQTAMPFWDHGTLGPAFLVDYTSLGTLSKTYVFVCTGLELVLVAPLCFFLLPVTLRRAKVRKVHLLRIAAWSMVVPPLLLQVVTSLVSVADGALLLVYSLVGSNAWSTPHAVMGWSWENRGGVFLMGTALWVWAWWSAACRYYLKLPRARGVAFAMVLIGALLAVCIALLTPGFSYYLLT
jgi:hypothetical protein